MSLKYKFFICFLVVSFVPLLLVGLLTFQRAEREITSRVISQLMAVADVQEKRVNETLNRYLDQAKLITSQTELRMALSEYVKTANPDQYESIVKMITDVQGSVPGVEQIAIINMAGHVIVSTHPTVVSEHRQDEGYFVLGQKTHYLYDLFKDKNNILRARLVGPIILEGRVIGVAEIVVNADPIVAVTEDYTGLGETGEVVLAKRNATGGALFLTPLRFDAGAALRRAVPSDKIDDPILSAVLGEDAILTDKTIEDYRGVSVFAATRFIDSVGWGLAVKIDRSEALAPVTRLIKAYIFIMVLAILLCIIVSFVLAGSISEPIVALTRLAQDLQLGHFARRTQVRSKDEIGFLGKTFNDMAEQLQVLYGRLAEKVSELEHANKGLETFNHLASHDLRAPLRGIKNLADILLSDYTAQLPSEAQKYLSMMKSRSQQMDQLIQDLLAFARLSYQPLKKQEVNIANLVHDALLELSVEQKGRRINMNICPLPVCMADPVMLKQVFVNLLSNALKYSRLRELATINVDCQSNDLGGEPIFFVKDNGIGFDLKYLDKLFSPFQRLHPADEYEGTGLGLTIVRHVIDRHGGRVWTESEVNAGATFFFTLGNPTPPTSPPADNSVPPPSAPIKGWASILIPMTEGSWRLCNAR
ncbi:MAG: ATP-binding protein [Nitrospirota bacterium]